MDSRDLVAEDVPALWDINEQGLPGVGEVSQSQLRALLSWSTYAIGAIEQEKLNGFVICLLPGTAYSSPNYAWFNDRYDRFLYVDRIAVGQNYRNKRMGEMLYQRVFAHARHLKVPVVAEVNLIPPNPGSMRFHERLGFRRVGSLERDSKAVAMLMRTD